MSTTLTGSIYANRSHIGHTKHQQQQQLVHHHVVRRCGTACGRGGAAARAATRAAAAAAKATAKAAIVYEGRMPLVGTEAIVAALPPALAAPLRLHSFVVVEEAAAAAAAAADGDGGAGATSSTTNNTDAWLYDFLPDDPTAPATAAALIAGRSVRGAARKRRLAGGRLPRGAVVSKAAELARCDARRIADKFTEAWPRDLSLAARNCRHHTAALLAALLAAEREALAAAAAAER